MISNHPCGSHLGSAYVRGRDTRAAPCCAKRLVAMTTLPFWLLRARNDVDDRGKVIKTARFSPLPV